MPNAEIIHNELIAVQEVFRSVAPTILKQAGISEYTMKQDGSPVTDVDVTIEKTIFDMLKTQFAPTAIYGEESGYDENDLPARCWLIDPIDGTKSFIANIPAYTNMAVLIEAGEAAACVIYNPSTDEMFTAQKGEGAFKDGQRLDMAASALPKTAFCKDRFELVLNGLLATSGITCEAGPQGAGYGFTAVAAGNIAARFNMRAGGYLHDYAPGALLVREAGGVLIPIAEDSYGLHTRSFVACHPALEAVLRANITRLRELEETS